MVSEREEGLCIRQAACVSLPGVMRSGAHGCAPSDCCVSAGRGEGRLAHAGATHGCCKHLLTAGLLRVQKLPAVTVLTVIATAIATTMIAVEIFTCSGSGADTSSRVWRDGSGLIL